jgi:hypothetical protein
MYIPSTFFSSQGACISASVSPITGSGVITSGSFISASVLYQYYKFEMSDLEGYALTPFTASLNILSGSTAQAKLLIVGAGGSGGSGSPGGSFVAADFAAGGGGGGGIVYYNQLPITSGSYRIEVGSATLPPPGTVGAKGKDSKFYYTNVYTPFTSSVFTAVGGGGGGFGYYDSAQVGAAECKIFYGAAGGTGGGVGRSAGPQGACDENTNGSNPLPNLYRDIQYNPQGYAGGYLFNGYPNFSVISATGGGGAGNSGSTLTVNEQAFGLYASNGGDGLNFNLTGTTIGVSPGGGGQAGGDTGRIGTCVNSGSAYGRGGQGERDNNHTSINFGLAGVVIIAWPICLVDSDNCREYVINGGATGGTMTYLPCDSQTLTTTTIDFAYTGSACLYKAGGYPTTTGTVTLTETGSCNTFIPIAPSVTCPTGSVKTPVYVYNWSIPGQCYPTPTFCQRQFYPTRTLNYVDVNAVSQSVSVGGWFTGTGQVCARAVPTPTISAGTVTNSGLICGYYCV